MRTIVNLAATIVDYVVDFVYDLCEKLRRPGAPEPSSRPLDDPGDGSAFERREREHQAYERATKAGFLIICGAIVLCAVIYALFAICDWPLEWFFLAVAIVFYIAISTCRRYAEEPPGEMF